jgi:hypothetical protein
MRLAGLCETAEQHHEPTLASGQCLALRCRQTRQRVVFGLHVSREFLDQPLP